MLVRQSRDVSHDAHLRKHWRALSTPCCSLLLDLPSINQINTAYVSYSDIRARCKDNAYRQKDE